MPSNRRAVALLINALGVGGAERVFVTDANRFAETGYDVTVFLLYGSSEDQFARELDGRVAIMPLSARGPFDLAAVRRMHGVMHERGIRVLISTLNDANIFARWCAIRGAGTIRLFMREANDPRRKTWWQRVLSVCFDWSAAGIIAVNGDVCTRLLRDAPWRRRKIIVLPNAVDEGEAHIYRDRPPLWILAVGSLTEQKDHATLIASLKILGDRGVDVRATVVGDGRLRGLLGEAAASAGIESKIEFTGKLPHAEVLKRYHDADVFVLTSRWEGSPNVLLEAMAHGLPSVVSDAPGIVEFAPRGTVALFARAGDAASFADQIERLAQDPDLRRSLGEAARAHVRAHFDPSARFERLESIVRGSTGAR